MLGVKVMELVRFSNTGYESNMELVRLSNTENESNRIREI